VLLVLVLLATGCTSSTTDGTGTNAPPPGGYEIRMPAHWNGTLLVFSHGYRVVGSAAANVPAAALSDPDGRADSRQAQLLLAKGYALAGYATPGWDVAGSLRAAEGAYRQFVQLHGEPKRTYAWGASFGGLITELLAERASWVDGAAAFCGVVAGPTLNFDNLQLAMHAIKVLLDPTLQVSGFTSSSASVQAAQNAARLVSAAIADPRSAAAAKVVYIAALLGLPTKSLTFPNGNLSQQATSTVSALQAYLQLVLQIRYDVQNRFGGNPARTSADIQTPEGPLITALGAQAASFTAALRAASPVAADATARAAVAAQDPTGDLRVPLITVHDAYDPIALAQNETVLKERVAHAGHSDRLAQFYVAQPGTTIGYEHCAFTDAQVVATIGALDSWSRSGVRPSTAGFAQEAGGVDTSFTPEPWPAASR